MAVQTMNQADFKSKVFDFTKGGAWAFQGERPAIIDFHATWCGPCKRLAPILDELAREYKGEIDIYKVDTDEEQELAAMFEIRSVPSLLFIPKEGSPQMAAGALPKDAFYEAIREIFKIAHSPRQG